MFQGNKILWNEKNSLDWSIKCFLHANYNSVFFFFLFFVLLLVDCEFYFYEKFENREIQHTKCQKIMSKNVIILGIEISSVPSYEIL